MKNKFIATFLMFLTILMSFTLSVSAQTGTTVIIKGSNTIDEIISDATHRFENMHKDVTIEFEEPNYGSTVGFEQLMSGDTDIAAMYGGPNSTQITNATNNGMAINSTLIAQDAFVIMVNPNNTIDSLTFQQIVDIYTGVTLNWSDLGWADGGQIGLYEKMPKTGFHSYFKNKFLNGGEIVTDGHIEYGRKVYTKSIYSEVQINENVIAYGSLGYNSTLSHIDDHVKLIKIDGVEPTRANAISGSYDYLMNIYLVFDQNTISPEGQGFVDYLVSPEGQLIIDNAGYIPVSTVATGFAQLSLDNSFVILGILTSVILYKKVKKQN